MTQLLGLALFVVGLAVGEGFPDIDQRTDLLLHRSILTHGPLVPGFLFVVAINSRSVPWRRFVMGASLGFAIHLAFDLFPRGWSGYALISLPGYGWTPVALSQAWIGLSMVACGFFAARLSNSCLETTLFGLGAIGLFISTALTEHALWRPAGAAIVACGAAIVLAYFRRESRPWE